jgi:hypothetical protein
MPDVEADLLQCLYLPCADVESLGHAADFERDLIRWIRRRRGSRHVVGGSHGS